MFKKLDKYKRYLYVLIIAPFLLASLAYVTNYQILKNNVNKQEVLIAQLSSTQVQLNKTYQDLDKLIINQKGLITRLNADLNKLLIDQQTLELSYQTIKLDLEDLTAANETLDKKIADTNRLLVSIVFYQPQTPLPLTPLNELNLDQQIIAVKDSIAEYQQLVIDVNANITSLNSSISTANALLTSTNDSLDAKQALKLELDEEIAQLKEELASIVESINNKEGLLLGVFSEDELTNQELIDEIDELKATRAEKEISLEEKSQDLDSLNEEIVELKADKDALSNLITNLNADLLSLNNSVDDLEATIESQTSTINTLNQEIVLLEADISGIVDGLDVPFSTVNEISQKAMKSNVLISLSSSLEGLTEFGSGIVYKSTEIPASNTVNYFILTNYQTIEKNITENASFPTIYVWNYRLSRHSAQIIKYDPLLGLAEIRVQVINNTYFVTPLAEPQTLLDVGQTIFALSSQSLQVNSLRVGTILSLDQIETTTNYFNHSAFAVDVNRGGSILNTDLKIIGINNYLNNDRAVSLGMIHDFSLKSGSGNVG